MYVIRTDGLEYRFNSGQAIGPLDLQVPEGAIYAFIGPNGAGKTTTIRLLLGLLRPRSGRIEVLGQVRGNNESVQIGSLVEAPSLYPHLTGWQNVEVSRHLLGVNRNRAMAVLDEVGLAEHRSRKVREYSLGMRQRLGLALALLGSPRILVLDEPANGLDPSATVKMRQLVIRLVKERGITLFLSSHLLAEVEQMATHVGILSDGKLVYQGALQELCREEKGAIHVHSHHARKALERITSIGISAHLRPDDVIVIDPSAVFTPDARADARLLRALVRNNVDFNAFYRECPTLESVFFRLTAPAGGFS